jgi:hypothetical protein
MKQGTEFLEQRENRWDGTGIYWDKAMMSRLVKRPPTGISSLACLASGVDPWSPGPRFSLDTPFRGGVAAPRLRALWCSRKRKNLTQMKADDGRRTRKWFSASGVKYYDEHQVGGGLLPQVIDLQCETTF